MAAGFSLATSTPPIRDFDGDCEIIAQFELGKYLKQLDPTYHHPDYRVDFLIRVSDGGKQHQLMLETAVRSLDSDDFAGSANQTINQRIAGGEPLRRFECGNVFPALR